MNSQICHSYSITERIKFNGIDVGIDCLETEKCYLLVKHLKIMKKTIVIVVIAEKPPINDSHC